MNSIKITRIYKWPTPENWMDIKAFLRFINFYRRFIQGFSMITYSLFNLTCSGQAWTWTNKEQQAYDDLKMVVTSALVLVLPQDLDLFRIDKANSSDFAMEAVLSQQSLVDGKQYLVAFYSKFLSLVEHNYKIYNKEMLAIIHVLEEQRHFLEEVVHLVEIWIDHKNLEYCMIVKKLNRVSLRYGLLLIPFTHGLCY